MKNFTKFSRLIALAVGIVIGANSHAQSQSFLTNGLISYYPFNGNANDAFGTNNGTPLGATLTTDRFGNANSAYSFNGNSSYIQTSQNYLLNGASNVTISAWVVINGAGQLLSAGDCRGGDDPISANFEIQSTVNVGFQDVVSGNNPSNQIGKGNTGFNSLPNLTSGIWHQIVITLDTTSNPLGVFKIYIDGQTNYVQIGSDDVVSAFTHISYDTPMTFLIGALNDTPCSSTPVQFWSGKIDDVRIYNRALSPYEVAQLYYVESAPSISIQKAVYLTANNLLVGSNYVVQASTDLINWTNQDSVFTATNSDWQSTNYWNVANWNQLFFRLVQQ